MVVSAAVPSAESTSCVYAVFVHFEHLSGVRHLYASYVFIVIHDTGLSRTVGSPSSVPHSHESPVAIRIRTVWQVVHSGIIGVDVFKPTYDTVVLQGIKVIALVSPRAAKVCGQRKRHGSMPLVAVGFLHLPEIAEGAAFVRMKFPDQMMQRLAVTVVFHILIILRGLVVDEDIVAQDTDAHRTQHVAQAPIRPIMVVLCPVASLQETDYPVVPHFQHPFFESSEVRGIPFRIVAHQFGSVGKLVAIQSVCQTGIRVSAHLLAGLGPSIKDLDGLVRIRLIAGYVPDQRTLVSRGGIPVSQLVIVRVGFPNRPASAYDFLDRGGFPVQTDMRAGQQFPVSGSPRLLAGFYLGFCPVQVGLRMQHAGMDEVLCIQP